MFEQAPPEIDSFIQPTDSEIFGKALTGFEVSRFEIPVGPENIKSDASGNPRSLSFKFEFADNEWFTDKAVEKKFWYRRASDGWAGLVSEPVKINWKKGRDPTQGLMDGATKLWEARKKAGDMKKEDLPEYKALEKLTSQWNGQNTSFFTWFAYVSGHQYVSAEESAAAVRTEAERKQNKKSGKEVEEAEGEDEDEELEQDDNPVEVHEAGEELANVLAEDLWPSAIKYFTAAQEMAEMGDLEFDDEDEDMEDDDDEDGPVDIRALVQSIGSSKKKAKDEAGPPKKKQKK